jgi:hypothetical protein
MLAAIAILMLAVLVAAVVVTGWRRAARPRRRHGLAGFDDGLTPYRSHAEASRRSEGERL